MCKKLTIEQGATELITELKTEAIEKKVCR